jgi:hypothetical protein
MHNYYHLFSKCALVPLTVGVITLPLMAQVDLGLSPMRVELPVAPGRSYSGTLVLTSAAQVKTRVRAELLDLYVDESTTPQFVASAPAEAAHSCRSWLSANPMEFEMPARGQMLVRYSLRVPTGASERSYHCALGFRSLPPVGENQGTTMHTAVRMITVFYPIVGKPPIAGIIKDLKLESVSSPSGTTWRAVVVMENSGLMMYRPAGSVDILDSSGKVIESQKLASFPSLPNRQQRYVLVLRTALSPGPYTLRAQIDVGGETQQASVAVKTEIPQPLTAEAPVTQEGTAK